MRKALLFVFYVAVVTPIGLVLRAVRDPMQRKVHRPAGTYWTEIAPLDR